MHRLPTIIQGQQRALLGKLHQAQAKKIIQNAELKNHHDSKMCRAVNRIEGLSRGGQRESIHTGGRYSSSGKSLFGNACEVWSDDMACILQGTCLPGSTKYCRTKSMFGRLELPDIMQGTNAANSPLLSSFSNMAVPSSHAFHTSALSHPHHLASSRDDALKLDVTPASSRTVSTLPNTWNDEIACILQGTCLPGSTRYCRTKSMFGEVALSDVMQGPSRHYSSTQPSEGGPGSPSTPEGQLTQRERLKRAVRDYGSTVIVFHVCISLMSLGTSYLAVSSGLDVASLMSSIGISNDVVSSRFATGTSTFLMAYAVHKVFAPVRIAITLTCTPFIVRYLRGVGVLNVRVASVTK